jgi:hypothetical protein
MRPGVEVNSRAARAARGISTDTGAWFVTGFAERGLEGEAVQVTSLDDFVSKFGNRVSYSQLYDALDLAFEEGLAEAYVSRVVGPAPVKASLTLDDRAGAPVDTLRIDALHYGDFANGATGITIQIENGTVADTFRIVVRFDGEIVETFDDLVMTAAADRYAPTILETSEWIRGVDLLSATVAPNDNPAVLAATPLAGGTDDHNNAVDAQWLDALDAIPADLGPGQVSAPGRTTTAAHQQLIDHAQAKNRTAYLDTVDKASEATLIAAAAAIDDYDGSEFAALFGSWFDIPGVVAGTTRAVPGSAYWAGKTAKIDAQFGTAGYAPAGDQGQADYALAVRVPAVALTDDDYEDLNDAGVNMAREFRNRGVQSYGFRSVTTDTEWTQLTSHRVRMSLTHRLRQIAEGFVFRNIDGRRQIFGELNGALVGELMRDYAAGSLFGDTPEDAFRVDTGDTVNTAATIAAGEIHAAVFVRVAPFAELVRIDIVKTPITSAV